MRILIFISLLAVSFHSYAQINQTDEKGLRQGLWQKKQANGRLMYEGYFRDNKPMGEWKRFHPGGQIKARIKYAEKSDSAFTQLFDEYGKMVAEGYYILQKKEGNWIYFSKNRKVAEEMYQNGIKNGVSKKYYDSGELMETTDWVNGKQEGNYKIYYKTGKPYMQCKMKQDQRHGLCLVHAQNGNLEMEAHYKNNLRDGEWKFYDEYANLRYTLIYNSGELLNPAVRDSIANLRMQNMEKGKGKIIDPEKFTEDPSGYMRQGGIYR